VRVLLLLAAACASAPESAPPPCTAVGGHVYLLAKTALAKTPVDAQTRATLESELPALRDTVVARCRDTAWPGSVRQCMAAATDHPAFVACEDALTEAQRAGRDPW